MKKKLLPLIFLLTLKVSLSFGQIKIDSMLLEHAALAPQLNNNIDDLISYLLKDATNQKDSISLICYWISDNIEYDLKGFLTNSFDDQSWFNTLSTRKAVCQGYSELLKEFCDRIGMESYVISGFSKGYGYVHGQKFQKTGHAWNIVKVNGDYQLFDLTWASGGVSNSDSMKFIKHLKPIYLFSDPRTFVENHLPTQRMWQLLEYPVTLENFENFDSSVDMIDSSNYFYNYTDTISSYKKLDEYDREMKDIQENYYVHPSQLNRAWLCYKKGYELSFGKYDESRYNKSLELLSIALAIYKTPEFSNATYVEGILKSMEYIKGRLEDKM